MYNYVTNTQFIVNDSQNYITQYRILNINFILDIHKKYNR